jgi:hypothetical protein
MCILSFVSLVLGYDSSYTFGSYFIEIKFLHPTLSKIKFLFIFAGDPLYAVGGQPKCLDCDFLDDSFAEDG